MTVKKSTCQAGIFLLYYKLRVWARLFIDPISAQPIARGTHDLQMQ
jgi:hypothetical protein